MQRRQIFGEAAEHLQYRFAIVQKHIAPHGGVGGSDAGEVAKAAGGKFDHLGFGDRRQVVGGADDIVGDQVRHVAGDGQHQIVVPGIHDLDPAAGAAPEIA